MKQLNQVSKKTPMFIVCCVLLTAASSVRADCWYWNDFEDPSDPLSEWSDTTASTTPGTPEHPADRFLGEFYNGTVSLVLEGLPAHTEVTVSFDLYIINTWDGNGITPGAVDEDFWELKADGQTLLYTTFSNNSDANQAYPEEYPGGDYPPKTCAAEINSLGYHPDGCGDAVYTFPNDSCSNGSWAFASSHGASVLQLDFSAYDLDSGIEDESWGLDNVCVMLGPAPAVAILQAESCMLHNDPCSEMCLPVDCADDDPPYDNVEPRLQLGTPPVLKVHCDDAVAPGTASCSVSCDPNPYGGGTFVLSDGSADAEVHFGTTLPDQSCCTLTFTGGIQDIWTIIMLEGDVNRDGSVSTADGSSVKARLGQSVQLVGAQYDVNRDCTISTADRSSVKARLEHVGPVPCVCP